jgi:hypothetical protein
MKKIPYLILFTVAGCLSKRTNKVPVYLENNSDADSVFNIKTLINYKFYKVVPVKRNPIADRYENLVVELPVKMDSIILTFIISETGDSTSCVLHRELMNAKSWVHVNFNETIFKKGSSYLGQVLRKDTLISHEFYSEIIPE